MAIEKMQVKESVLLLGGNGFLQHFAEGDAGDQGSDQDSIENNAGQQGSDGSQQQDDKFIPKTRFDEVNSKYKEMKTQFDKLQEQLSSQAKQKELEELETKKKQGEFEELYTKAQQELDKYKPYETRVKELEATVQVLVDAELETIDETFHDLIPANLSAEQKLTWIKSAKSKGLFGEPKEDKKNTPLGQPTNPTQQTQNNTQKMSALDLFRTAYGSKK